MIAFKQETDFDQRVIESTKILSNFPDRIPIIVERSANWTSSNLPALDKKKFLCPGDISLAQFLQVIRKRLELEADKGLFLTVSETFLPPSSALLSQVYQSHKDSDGFLYVTYATESVFGK